MIFYRIVKITFRYPNGRYKSRLTLDTRKFNDIGFTRESLVSYIKDTFSERSDFIIESDRFYPYAYHGRVSLSLDEFLELKKTGLPY